MSFPEYLPLRQKIVTTAQTLITREAISPAHLSNISIRTPERDMMLLTSGGWITDMTTDDIALVGFDSTVRAGQLPGGTFEIVEMHSKVYEKRPDIGAIIHTHSPYATAFAIANKPLPCVYEAMARFDMHDGVPVAPYAPRGSKESVTNILSVIGEKTRCVLLQNHGILAFGETIEVAMLMALILEEAAHMAILAESLGGATIIPEDQAFYALQRTRQYADMIVTPADGE
ncbi:MAG: class II aldolase/adducin family protein [Chloroflexota bacterium]|nr:class II aldolase/adducin family protein [Chloroflexota bacterium]